MITLPLLSTLSYLNFRFTGWNMVNFIVESLVHSAHVRDPSSIIDHAGYYG